MKKTERKNKTNIVVNWPTALYYNIEDLKAINSDVKTITLRVRHQKEIDAGRVVEIGCITGSQGRPKKVWAKTPVSEATLALAKSKGVSFVERTAKEVPLVNFVPKVTSIVA